MIDVEELKRLMAEATQGEWCCDEVHSFNSVSWHVDCEAAVAHIASCGLGSNSNTNAALIVALHNAAPELIAMAERCDHLMLVHLPQVYEAGGWVMGEDNLPYLVACLKGERDELKKRVEELEAFLAMESAANERDQLREVLGNLVRRWRSQRTKTGWLVPQADSEMSNAADYIDHALADAKKGGS